MLSHRTAWQDWRVMTTVVLVFLAGALSGALTMQQVHHNIHGRELSYDRLKTDLSLNAQQADQIKMILDDFVKYNQDLQAQIEDVRATGKNRIMAILNPEQKKSFEKICSEVQR